MPKFSIIIPTRQRPDTLRFALQTAVTQDFDDVEILVHESGDDPSTAEVVSEVGDQRTRHLQTVDPVPMSEVTPLRNRLQSYLVKPSAFTMQDRRLSWSSPTISGTTTTRCP